MFATVTFLNCFLTIRCEFVISILLTLFLGNRVKKVLSPLTWLSTERSPNACVVIWVVGKAPSATPITLVVDTTVNSFPSSETAETLLYVSVFNPATE